MDEQDRVAMEQDQAPEGPTLTEGHTLTITNPMNPHNPRVYHNIDQLTSFSSALVIVRMGDTAHSCIYLHSGDVVDMDGIQSERF